MSIELPITLFDAPGALVPSNRGADMVWASAVARSGDFLLRLCGRTALASAHLRRSYPLRPRTRAVAREHSLGRLQLAELAGELLALRIDARERLTDPLLLFGNFV